MRLYKLLTLMLLFTLVLNVQAWSAEPLYTRAQVDSIVAAEVAHQLKDQQIELQIERVSNEKYAHSLDEQNNRLVEHDHKMSSRYTWIGVLITLISALFGIGGPLLLRKDSKEILEAIADNNTKALDSNIKEHDGKINGILSEVRASKSSIEEVECKVNELAAGAEKARKEAEESAKQAKASECFSQASIEKDLDKKIELYTEAIIKNPGYAEAYNNRGNIYSEKGIYDEAIKDYSKAMELKPHCAKVFYNRGKAYLDKGDYNSAIGDFSTAIGIESDFASYYNSRGMAYFNKGDVEASIIDYNMAIKLDSENSEAYMNRGVAYRYIGDLDNAIKDYTMAIQLKPENALAYNNRGVAYVKKGCSYYSAAMVDYEKSIRLNGNDAKPYSNRGELKYLMEDYTGSIEDCTKALDFSHGPKVHSYYYRSLSYQALGGEENLNLALADARNGIEASRKLGEKSPVNKSEFEKLIKELLGE